MSQATVETTKYITEKEVSEITGIALPTLRKQRWCKKGIPFVKLGKSVRYLHNDVINYMEARKIHTNN